MVFLLSFFIAKNPNKPLAEILAACRGDLHFL